MSTLSFRNEDVIDLSTYRAQDDALAFEFTCPRCGTNQMACMNADKLKTGKVFTCRNKSVCGGGNMRFRVRGIHLDFFEEYLTWRPSIEEVLPEHIDWGRGYFRDTELVPLKK